MVRYNVQDDRAYNNTLLKYPASDKSTHSILLTCWLMTKATSIDISWWWWQQQQSLLTSVLSSSIWQTSNFCLKFLNTQQIKVATFNYSCLMNMQVLKSRNVFYSKLKLAIKKRTNNAGITKKWHQGVKCDIFNTEKDILVIHSLSLRIKAICHSKKQ